MSNSATDTGKGATTPDDPAGRTGTPPGNGAVEPARECLKKGELQKIIACLEKALEKAQQEKRTADGAFDEADGLLAAMRNVQKEGEKAKQTYEAAYPQLKIDQQGYADYGEQEKDSLEDRIGTAGVEAVGDAVRERRDADAAAVKRVVDGKAALAAAEDASSKAKDTRKAKAARVDEYKQLPATIGVHHKILRALRDEAAKARQAGQYGLAYWLVTRKAFTDALAGGKAELIPPDELPDKLRIAVTELTAAELDEAAKDAALADARAALKQAEKDLATQNATGETRLREALRQIPPVKVGPYEEEPDA